MLAKTHISICVFAVLLWLIEHPFKRASKSLACTKSKSDQNLYRLFRHILISLRVLYTGPEQPTCEACGTKKNCFNDPTYQFKFSSSDEDDWNSDNVSVMKKTMGNIEAKTPSALDWLNNPEGMVGAMGEKALGQVWPTSVCFYVGGKSLFCFFPTSPTSVAS